MKSPWFFILFCIFFFTNVQAASFPSYYCDTTFKTVKLGDSLEAVKAACGNPASATTRQEQVVTPITTTQWIYTLNLQNKKGATVDYLPALSIVFRDRKVVQVERSNLPSSGGSYCVMNNMVNIGDAQDSVLNICGQPNVVNSRQDSSTSSKEVVEWVYNFGPYKPQIIFNFEGGVLTQISSGALGR